MIECRYDDCFDVFKVAMRIRLISKQSASKESPSVFVMYSDNISSLNQYSVSAVSFSAICSLAIKSALLEPYVASFIFAPMLVPLLIICLEIAA